MKRLTATALTLATAAAGLVLSAAPATAASAGRAALAEAPGERRNVLLWNIRDRRCVNGPGVDGGNVLVLNCNSGWGSDRWDLVKVRDAAGNEVARQYFVINSKTKACLEIGGWSSVDGATAMTWSCHKGTNQIWLIWPRDDGYYEFQNLAGKKCLDARHTAEWTDITQWRCHGGGEQVWWINA
ncbi:RICIN domain-containing protein [Herbidospora yilanensis]|uniref:RICIN domain-containing protein n=1 Tax=Herbidospora yilanensis TaxID=354426 RepID=UPI0007860376|nr:RICIN domain-containing protein [Herbidospora yilanensis]